MGLLCCGDTRSRVPLRSSSASCVGVEKLVQRWHQNSFGVDLQHDRPGGWYNSGTEFSKKAYLVDADYVWAAQANIYRNDDKVSQPVGREKL